MSSSSRPPIVYTIAGSDSGGGAGIQADLHAIHSFGCHGCSAITCLTAQNSCGVTGVHAPPPSFLKEQLQTLKNDLPPKAIKIGMLGTKELAETVGDFLKEFRQEGGSNKKPWVVLDPVMISTSGHKLIDDEAMAAMIEQVFPHTDVLTPNKYEAEALLGRKLNTPQDVEQGAKELLQMKCKSVLIKGGHSLMESRDGTEVESNSMGDLNATLGYAQDYFLSSTPPTQTEARLCDSDKGVWLRSKRFDTENTHGTGCTLSSSIAASLARHSNDPLDACCLAKAYVSTGIGRGVQLGQGPGPVVHTAFPSSHFPTVAFDPQVVEPTSFRPLQAHDGTDDSIPKLGRILPIVDSVEWVAKLCTLDGVQDIQLRIKGESDPSKILDMVKECQSECNKANVRLWINDYWEAAIEAGCFGVHVGQEDLATCKEEGGLVALRKANLALGISTHSYGELAVAMAVRPSYISLGPVFGTTSKVVNFAAQGLNRVSKWRQLIPNSTPLVTIGGIGDAAIAKQVKDSGSECVAIIGAITKAPDAGAAVASLNKAMA